MGEAVTSIYNLDGTTIIGCDSSDYGGGKRVTNNNSATRWVDPIRSMDDVKKITDYLQSRVNSTTNMSSRRLAARNKLLFILGTRTGFRVSDLIKFRWGHFFDKDGNYHHNPQNTKEQKTGKLRAVYCTDEMKKYIDEYIEFCDIIPNRTDYIFFSRKKTWELYDVGVDRMVINDKNKIPDAEITNCEPKGLDNNELQVIKKDLIRSGIQFAVREFHLTNAGVDRIVKDFVKACGLRGNYSGRSLRKTYAYQLYQSYVKSGVDTLAAVENVRLFLNHSKAVDTMRYLGFQQKNEEEQLNKIEWK
jgi:integrase